MMVTLESGSFGWDYVLTATNGEQVTVDSDWMYPSLAELFGWRHAHRGTDGTVDCRECGMSAYEMMMDAGEFLDAHIGDSVEDQGYV